MHVAKVACFRISVVAIFIRQTIKKLIVHLSFIFDYQPKTKIYEKFLHHNYRMLI